MSLSLPYDVLKCIFDYVEDNRDLVQCCLTSKIFLRVAQPRLYDTIRIWIMAYDHISRGDRDDLPPEYGIAPNTNALLSVLRQHPHLVSLVRAINWGGSWVDVPDPEQPLIPALPYEPTKLLDELVQLLTSARHFHFAYLPSQRRAETAVYLFSSTAIWTSRVSPISNVSLLCF
ncbi:F-box protein [Sporobolomyces salmoneus]|uniref:F-box protein n=1 Tax=Sporobolomyces salmoneus TaxID=183962 RepID=UPI00317611A1